MEFTKVNSGAFKLCYGGFTYTKKAEKKNRIRWECSKRKTDECKGAVTTLRGPVGPEIWTGERSAIDQPCRSAILADSYDGGKCPWVGGIVQVGNCPGGMSRGEMSYTRFKSTPCQPRRDAVKRARSSVSHPDRPSAPKRDARSPAACAETTCA